MTRLVGYELRKILSNKILLVLIVILLGATVMEAWRPWTQASKTARYGQRFTKPHIGILNDAPTLPEEDLQAFLSDMHSLSSDFGAGTLDQSLPGKYLDTVAGDLFMAGNVAAQQQRFDEAMAIRENIISSARRLGRDAVEAGDTFNIRRNLDIIETFSVRLKPEWTPTRGWNFAFGNNLQSIFVMVLVLGAAATVFSAEKETGAIQLIATSRKGRGATAAAKILACTILAFLLSILFTLVTMFVYHYVYGLWSFTMPLLILQDFHLTPLNISTSQFLVISALFKAAGAVLFAGIACMISALCKSNLKAYIASAAVLGLSFGYSFLHSYLKWPEALHAFDITLFTRPSDYFARYFVADIFTYPVMWAIVHAVCAALILSAVCAIAVRAHTHRPQRM